MKKLDPALLSKNIESRVESDIARHNICAASVIVNQNGRLIYKKHFGVICPGNETPVSDSTLYRLASMTKPITAVAVMTLVDRGLIDPDDPIEKYLSAFADMSIGEPSPEWELRCAGPAGIKPTIRHLLSHSSGIGSGWVGDRTFAMMTAEDHRTLENAVNAFAKQWLSYEPGTKQEYSPIAAFDVLARVIEVVSEKDIGSYLNEKIFVPCGMKDTTFVPTPEQRERLVAMHKKETDGSSFDPMPDGCIFETIPVTHPLGGGGLISSLADYSNFAEMLLNGGVCNGNRIVSEAAIAEMSSPQVATEIQPGNERWGLGVRVITGEAYTKLPVGAFGWSGAYGTHFWVDPVNKVTAVYMKNSRHDGGAEAETAANFEQDVFDSFE